ncbi:MAG TPA: hypothetical protein PKA06_13760, partial [Gemmatales bacterium]|nr:hypothetical protein [Gemmatales bacterium]
HPKPGETYAIPPGTIHAVGSGVMVLEVQQSSDATFRLFDWDRGRELHVEAGLACLAEHPMAGLQTPVRLSDGSELLVETPFFSMKRWQYAKSATLPAPCIAVIWNGTAKAEGWTLPAGYACLVPACINNAAIEIPNGTIVFVVEWKMQD